MAQRVKPLNRQLRIEGRLGRVAKCCFEGSETARLDLLAAATVVLGLCWRLWLAQATYFNTDEAWHYSVANQNSVFSAYRASLTLAHPPLLVLILYFWRHLGTSDLILRLPAVLAGSIFCWIFYKWLNHLLGGSIALVGVIFASLLPPMITVSSELRQYSLMLMFAVCAAYFLERALDENSVGMTLLSSISLLLAMLSHYSAFLFAAALGVYSILRMLAHKPTRTVVVSWVVGQAAGVGLAGILYTTHISKLGTVYPVSQPLRRFGDFYLSDWYFHSGRDRLLPFLYRGTFGIFRFIFGQTGVGQIAAVLFVAGTVLLLTGKVQSKPSVPARLLAVALIVPFTLNWVAVLVGLYPYGRTRQCMFLAISGLSGVSICLVRIARNHTEGATALALGLVAICQIFGTLQGRDMLPLTEQRHEYMDQAVQFVRSHVSSQDTIFTDQATGFQLRHYLCQQKPVSTESWPDGLESFQCEGFRVVLTGANDGALTADAFVDRFLNRQWMNSPSSANQVWVVQAGWARGLGEALQKQFPAIAELRIRSFGQYIEILQVTRTTH